MGLVDFLPFSTKDNICNSLFAFWKVVYSKRKEFVAITSKFFPIRADPFLEGNKTISDMPPGKLIHSH